MIGMQTSRVLAGLALLSVSYALHAQTIEWAGRPANPNHSLLISYFANLGNISEDGSSLVQGSDYPLAYRWLRGQGWQQIGGFLYNCSDLSGDGQTIVGIAPTGIQTYSQPARYNAQTGVWQTLGLPNGFRSGGALCVSRSGSTIAGSLSVDTSGAAIERPFVYRNNSYTLLPIPSDNPPLVYAVGISPEGSVVVGTAAYEDTIPVHALRWDANGLTMLPKPAPNWGAWAVSASENGAVIVGGGRSPNGVFTPLRWQNNTVSVLPTGNYGNGFAQRTTRTAQVITGSVFSDSSGVAVRWSACGFENLNTAYSNLLRANELLLTAHALSQSGRYIAGLGTRDGGNTVEMYVLDTNKCWDPAGNVDADCCVDDADLLQVLFDFGNTGVGRPTDLNCDGTVDDADLLIVLFNFGVGC